MFNMKPEIYLTKEQNAEILMMLHGEFCLHSTIRYERENCNTRI